MVMMMGCALNHKNLGIGDSHCGRQSCYTSYRLLFRLTRVLLKIFSDILEMFILLSY